MVILMVSLYKAASQNSGDKPVKLIHDVLQPLYMTMKRLLVVRNSYFKDYHSSSLHQHIFYIGFTDAENFLGQNFMF